VINLAPTRLTPRHWFILAAALLVPVLFSMIPPPAPEVGSKPTAAQLAAVAAQHAAAARLIRAFGYDCQSVDAVLPYALSEGANVSCNHFRYMFEIENHGGRWSVKSD
jgi:hypothetical protein